MGRRYAAFLAWGLVLGALYLSSLYGYLLFHGLAELFSIVVAAGIFIIAWNSRRFLDNNYLLYIGIAYLFVAFIDLVHTLAYKGMGVFRPDDPNTATQLWIIARYMESVSLLLAPRFLTRQLKPNIVFGGYFLATVLALGAVFYWDVFPTCFVEGTGLTPFKKVSEYVISLILFGAILLLLAHRDAFERQILQLVIWSIAATIVSELAFTFYVSVYGFSNLVGHYAKIVSFYLIYKAIVERGLTRPYDLLFRNLKHSEDALKASRDELEIRVQERSAQLFRANEELRAEIGRRTRAEEELRGLNEDLEERIAERTSQLQAANQELEAFSYSVSHDLRAPLRAVEGFSRILLEEPTPLAPDARHYLQAVRENAQRMAQLIEGLLAFSRLGRQPLKTEAVRPAALAREAFVALGGEREGGRVDLRLSDLPPCQGDPMLLRQVFTNLIANALKFTRPREVAEVEVGSRREDGHTVYFVRDNGVGFDMRYADKLFGVFQRLHSDEAYEGTGLGLAIVQRIVHRHGGRVWAEAAPDRGATFYFTLEGAGSHATEGGGDPAGRG